MSNLRSLSVLALVTLLAAASGACASVTNLTRGGEAIRVLNAGAEVKCNLLGDVSKMNTNTWQTRAEAELDARNKVLNAAADKRGTHILSLGFGGKISMCDDCVELRADIYGCPAGVSDQSADEAFPPPAAPVEEEGDGSILEAQ